MRDKDKKEQEENKRGAIFIPAGVLLGLGIGMVYNNVAAGILIGLGVGFTLYAIITVLKK
jgi:hypothetical protein